MFNSSALRNLSYEEIVALKNLESACPGGTQDRDLPVPGKPGHYYPRQTMEYLRRKLSRRIY